MDLFGPLATPDTLTSTKLRLEQVRGDNMEPTLRANRDLALCLPVHTYTGSGIYLLGNEFGWNIYRCENILSGEIRLSSDNKIYPPQSVPLDYFNENVVAKVVADVKVRDGVELARQCN